MSIGFVECSRDHNQLPHEIVCVHLLRLQSFEWIRTPNDDSWPGDWLCSECYKNRNDRRRDWHDITRAMCVPCIDQMRWLLDRNYKLAVPIRSTTVDSG